MNRHFLPAVLALAFAGSAAIAQQQAPPADSPQQSPAPITRHHRGPNPERESKMLSKRLNLTPDQTAKLEPILADRDQKMKALHENSALTPQDRRQQMRAIHQDMKQQLNSVLTPDQIEQMKSMRGHHGPHGQPAAAPAPSPSV